MISQTLNKMHFLFIFTAITLLFQTISAIPYKQCDATRGNLIDFKITGCEDDDDKDTCIIKPGIDINIAFKIEPYEDIQSAYVEVSVIEKFFGFSRRINIPQNNICNIDGLTCPFMKGHVVEYSKKYIIQENFPRFPFPVDIQVNVKDSKDDAVIACVIISLASH